MESINDRIAQCIDKSGLTKTAFAQRIGLAQSYISALSIGKKLPSDRTISDICREFQINESWLRTGDGEMFRKTPETQAERLAQDYGLDDLGCQIMSAYMKLDENDRLAVGRLIRNLTAERGDVTGEHPQSSDPPPVLGVSVADLTPEEAARYNYEVDCYKQETLAVIVGNRQQSSSFGHFVSDTNKAKTS